MATETLTGAPQPFYSHEHQGVQAAVTTLEYAPFHTGRFGKAYRHFVQEVPLSRAPGTVQGTSAALIALFASATVLLVDEPGQQRSVTQVLTSEHVSSGSVGQLLGETSRAVVLGAAEQEDLHDHDQRGVFALSFEKRVLFTKQVRLTDVPRRAPSKITIIGGREHDDDE
jgi:hypothetical protein